MRHDSQLALLPAVWLFEPIWLGSYSRVRNYNFFQRPLTVPSNSRQMTLVGAVQGYCERGNHPPYQLSQCVYTASAILYWLQACMFTESTIHDDVIKWKHFPRYWPFVRGIHRSPVNSPHKSQWRGALVFSLICAWINGCVNNRETGDLRCHRALYNVTVMQCLWPCLRKHIPCLWPYFRKLLRSASGNVCELI